MLERVDCVTVSASAGDVGESGLCDSICIHWGMLERVDCVTVSASAGGCWREWIV